MPILITKWLSYYDPAGLYWPINFILRLPIRNKNVNFSRDYLRLT